MDYEEIIQWLLAGDVSIQYQVHRDLLSEERKDLQDLIALEGWGSQFLAERKLDGHWGREFYQPKWKSTHYTLLDLRNISISPDNSWIKESIDMVLKTCKTEDGGILLLKAKKSDVCVNGMFLNYASYFRAPEAALQSVIDMLLKERMKDGGFNCRSNRSAAFHSSFHSTLSVLEGFTEYVKNRYSYRIREVKNAIVQSKEFLLLHQLFISDKTGKIVNKDFLRFSYPRRWRYDILSALDYFQYSETEWDSRLRPAIDYVLKKRNKEGTWNLRAKYDGQTHFDMEKAGMPSRWNTLRALRVLNHFGLTERPLLIFVSGLPGSGKSYFASRLSEKIGALYVSSDELRKEMFPSRTYSAVEKAKVYQAMLEKMKRAIIQKKNLVLDATFHRNETRQLFAENAKRNALLYFIELQADQDVTKERLKKRRPYSEADYEVHRLIRQKWEPLEKPHLTLESTNENIAYMLEKATQYLNNDKGGNR